MSNYDKALLKSTPSMLKAIAVQSAQLKGHQNVSLSIGDACGMANLHFFCPNTCGVNKRIGLLASNIAKIKTIENQLSIRQQTTTVDYKRLING